MASRDRDIGKKYDSGSFKRKNAEKRKELEGQLGNSLTKFLKTVTSKNVSDTETSKKTVTCGTLELDSASLESPKAPDNSTPAGPSSSTLQSVSATSELQLEQRSLQQPIPGSTLSRDLSSTLSSPDSKKEKSYQSETEENDETKNIYVVSDPYLWPNHLTQSERTRIIEKGPVNATDKVFPKNESGRHFSNIHYTRHLSNGEQQKRRWLIYSESNDSVHCFACRLFSDTSKSALSSRKGTNDWQHLSVILKCHENNKVHKECMLNWFDLEKRLKVQKTIDRETEAQIRSEAQRWKDIMQRLLAIVQFLASYNLAFRGHKETITSDSSDRSGNFLDLVKLIAKFDPILREH